MSAAPRRTCGPARWTADRARRAPTSRAGSAMACQASGTSTGIPQPPWAAARRCSGSARTGSPVVVPILSISVVAVATVANAASARSVPQRRCAATPVVAASPPTTTEAASARRPLGRSGVIDHGGAGRREARPARRRLRPPRRRQAQVPRHQGRLLPGRHPGALREHVVPLLLDHVEDAAVQQPCRADAPGRLRREHARCRCLRRRRGDGSGRSRSASARSTPA